MYMVEVSMMGWYIVEGLYRRTFHLKQVGKENREVALPVVVSRYVLQLLEP